MTTARDPFERVLHGNAVQVFNTSRAWRFVALLVALARRVFERPQ